MRAALAIEGVLPMANAAVSVSAPPRSPAIERSRRRGRIFLRAAFVSIALAVIGFWPTYFGPLVSGSVHGSLLIHVHAVVMVTWMALFVVQICLAISGRVRLHMRLGQWVMGYAVVMMVVSLLTTSERFAAILATGDAFRAQRWLFGILREVAFIVAFLAAGWAYRKRPEIHKRLMLVATTMVVVPAVGRMVFLGTPVPLWAFMVIWPLPVYLALIHDFRSSRVIHPAYVIGIASMLAERLVLPLGTSPAWQAMAAHITAFYR
jgi:hypothetical protein